MKILLIFFLLLFTSSILAQSYSTECKEQIKSELKLKDKVSILKKDQQTIQGYLYDMNGSSLTINTNDYSNPIVEVELVDVNSITLQHFDLKTHKRNKHISFGIGALLGFGMSLGYEYNQYNNNRDSFDIPVIAGITAISGLFTMVIATLKRPYNNEKHTINCAE